MNPRSAFGAILVVIGLIGLYYVFSNEGKLSLAAIKNYFSEKVFEQQAVDLSGVSNLKVESDSLDVIVVRGTGSKALLTIKGHATKSAAKKIELNTEKSGDALHVELNGSPGGFSFGMSSVKLTIELPEHAWDELDIDTNSGDIRIDQQRFMNANIHSNSGDIESRSLTVLGNLDIESNSGDAEFNDVKGTSMALKTSSGDISIEGYAAEHIQFEASSGDVDLEDGSAQIVGNTNSGDITLRTDDLLHNTELTSGSGDVAINLDNEPKSLEIQFSTGSGDGVIRKNGFIYDEISSEDHMRGMFGNGDIKLSVATSSGDFILK